jgi:ribose 5-phosphate isomerase A
MLDRLSPPERGKLFSAYHAMAEVQPGMRVGLGTGSTAAWLVRLLGARRHIEGLDFTAVSTSEATEALAVRMGIPTTTLDAAEWLDVTIDGADEFDPALRLIKGGGGALLREKIVATASERMVVITDPSKEVATLGAFALPVEVVKFAWTTTATQVADVLGWSDVDRQEMTRRDRDGAPFETDEGHYILDLDLGRIGEPEALAAELLAIAGVVETGLFLGIAERVVIGASSGEARVIRRGEGESTRELDDPARLDALLARLDAMEDGDG